MRNLQIVPLKDEEWQAISLIDYQGQDQAEAAGHMGISRPTFSRVLSSARRAVARALVEGAAIKIGGGDFFRPSEAGKGCSPMKVIVTAAGDGAEARVDPKFGRAPWFILYDLEAGTMQAHENPGPKAASGAGVAAAQAVISLGAQVVLTGVCGPNATSVLGKAKVTTLNANGMTVAEAMEAYKSGKLVTA